jgi:hypothetical protein
MGLRIGCDLDGTLADMDAALRREAEALFGPGVALHPRGGNVEMPPVDDQSSGDAAVLDGAAPADVRPREISRQQLRQLWAHVGTVENFCTTLEEIEDGAVARLAELAAARRWDVIFFTQRPETAGDTPQLQTQRWLRAHGFDYPSVFIVGGARGRIAAAMGLHAVLDDRLENCMDVAGESKARPILIWRAGADTVPPGAKRLGIDTVLSFAEGLARLEEMAASRRATFVSRVRRAMRR